MADLLAGSDPEATDRAILASLPRSIASIFRPVVEAFIDPVYGYDEHLGGYMLAGPSDPDDRQQALDIVEAGSTPASEPVVKAELARLRASTKARAEEVGDLAMTMQVMAEECAEWPADVMRAALRRWARRERWFPALAELRDELQRVGRNRRLMAAALGGRPAKRWGDTL